MKITPRWNEAQSAERKYWNSRREWIHKKNLGYKFWQEGLEVGLNLGYSYFNNKDVLEIGCGPAGIIFSIETTKSRIGLEPMDINQFNPDPSINSIIRNGVGEDLPFESESFDVVICFNTLDHTINPSMVVDEIRRVLRVNGQLLLCLHVLRNSYRFARVMLDKLDKPHPFHFTVEDILQILKEKDSLEIVYKKVFPGLGPFAKSTIIPPKKNFKYYIGCIIMEDLWLRLEKTQ